MSYVYVECQSETLPWVIQTNESLLIPSEVSLKTLALHFNVERQQLRPLEMMT